MLEWLKRRVWKARDLPKGFAGSNPALSAESRGCHQPRLFASTAGSPFLFFLERGIIFISCAFASMVVPSPPPLSALHRYPPLLQHVPICTGGSQTSSQSSYAQGNPLQACSDPRRRTADDSAFLLRIRKPPPSVFRLSQEDRRRPCTPPVQTLSLSGSFSKSARPVPGVQGAPLRPQEDRQRLCSPPTRRETPSKHVLTSYAPYSSFASAASGIPPFPSRIPDK